MDEGLRLAIMAGNFSPSLHRQMEYQADEQREECRLQALCRPARLEAAEAEVQARRERIESMWLQVPDAPPPMTPRAAALRSVARDVMEGLLPY
jgi:hypothetical protein